MGLYIVKMDGEKIRSFSDKIVANAWAKKHCKYGKVEIVKMGECPLPKASSKIYPSLDMADLRYRPFQSLA